MGNRLVKSASEIRPFYDSDDIIKVITGVRRCGKSSLMLMVADELLEKGIAEEDTIFLDLNSRGYRKIKTPDQLEQLIESKLVSDHFQYLFIDEIQNVVGFEEEINGYRTDVVITACSKNK